MLATTPLVRGGVVAQRLYDQRLIEHSIDRAFAAKEWPAGLAELDAASVVDCTVPSLKAVVHGAAGCTRMQYVCCGVVCVSAPNAPYLAGTQRYRRCILQRTIVTDHAGRGCWTESLVLLLPLSLSLLDARGRQLRLRLRRAALPLPRSCCGERARMPPAMLFCPLL